MNNFLSCISYTQVLATLELSKAQLRKHLCITYTCFMNSVDTIQDLTKAQSTQRGEG